VRGECEIKCPNCPDGIRSYSEEGWSCHDCCTVINFCYDCNVQMQLVNWCVYSDEPDDDEDGEESQGEGEDGKNVFQNFTL
jgi:hypothetical protein